MFPIYCINLKDSKERRARMEKRFEEKKILDKVTFVQAIPFESQIINYYRENSQSSYSWMKDEEKSRIQHLKDIACYASHIKAIRIYLEESQSNFALICEDNILFHNNFLSNFHNLFNNVPKDTTIISLTHMNTGPIDQTCVGLVPEMQNLWKINSEYTWGAQAYLISKDYTVQVLNLFDHPFDVLMKNFNEEKISSEIIIRRSEGYMASTPLVIEDCISSDRAPQDVSYHVKFFCYWDYSNYNLSDPNKLSPISRTTPLDAWKGYPYRKDDPFL